MALLAHGALPRFLIQVLLILALSRGLGWVMRRINQPLVIGEILAGILLGPSLLGWVFPEVTSAIFPESSLPGLFLISQLGLILFMFLVGLELDPGSLRGRGRAAVLISQSSIALPFALGALLAWHIWEGWSSPQVPLLSFALFLGAAMSITAFPVLARILSERRLLRTRLGNVAITVAAVDDISAWCILALVVSLARTRGLDEAAITAGFTVLYIAGMWFLARPFLRRLAARAETSAGMTQGKVALVLGMLLVSAYVTEWIGIHALFGAFLFGVILPRDGELAQALAGKVEDVVLVLFLPLFFAYSGLRTEIALLNTPAAWWAVALIILVACAGKFGGGALTAWLTGLSGRESAALGVLINTRGLVELVALNIGLDLGVISPAVFTMMVLMALVTTFMTSPILELIYPKEQLARDLMAEAPREPGGPEQAPFSVLICVSDARSGPGLLRLAGAFNGRGPRSSLYALSLAAPMDRASDLLRGAPSIPGSTLVPLIDQAASAGMDVQPMSFVSSQPAEDICGVASAKAVDLILLGWHKPLLGAAQLGGVVSDVMRSAPADVAVFVDRGSPPPGRILLPYRGSRHDRLALELAVRLTHGDVGQLTLLHVADDQESGIAGAPPVPLAPLGLPLPPLRHIAATDKSPIDAVLAEAQGGGYDLIIVGMGDTWGLRQRSVGFQPERLIQQAPISLLIAHQRGESAA